MSVMQLRATIILWDTQKIICFVLYFQKKSFGKIIDSKISKANNIPTRILTFKKKKWKKKGERKTALYMQDHLACKLTKTWKIVY